MLNSSSVYMSYHATSDVIQRLSHGISLEYYIGKGYYQLKYMYMYVELKVYATLYTCL